MRSVEQDLCELRRNCSWDDEVTLERRQRVRGLLGDGIIALDGGVQVTLVVAGCVCGAAGSRILD